MRPKNPKFICVDCETTGLDWTKDTLHGFAYAYEEGEAIYVNVSDIPNYVKEDLENSAISVIGHNLHAFDAKFLFAIGIKIQGKMIENMGIWQLLDDTTPLGLKFLSEKHIGLESLERKRLLDDTIKKAGVSNIAGLCAKDLLDASHPYLKVIGDYCEEDCNNTLHLALLGMEKLKELDKKLKEKYRVTKTPLDYFREEFTPLESVLFKIETEGFRVNLAVIEKLRASAEIKRDELTARLNKGFKEQIAIIEDKLYQSALLKLVMPAAKAKRIKGEGKLAFSWENANHVAILFFEHTNFPEEFIRRTARGSYATDKTYINGLMQSLPKGHILLKAIPIYAKYKLNQKVLTTYTGDSEKGIYSKIRKGEDGNHYIYPTFRQTTTTGRLACKSPNMQNIPRNSPIKELFIPTQEGNVFDHFDYSQIELRIAGHLANDKDIIAAYINGDDVHKQTAATLFEIPITEVTDIQRQVGKTSNFLTIYKGGAYRLQESLRQPNGSYPGLEFSKEECQEFIDKFFERYPDLTKYLANVLVFVRKNRFVISEVGRIRRLSDIAFGDEGNLNYKTKRFGGTQQQRQLIIQDFKTKSIPNPSEDDIFWAAHKRYNHAVKQAFNFPDQSLSASIIKRAMIKLHADGISIRNQVHDSLDIEREEKFTSKTDYVRHVMETIYPCRLPIKVDFKTLRSFSEEDKA